MSTEIYRQTKLGDALVSALEELLDNEKITPDLAIKVLSEVGHSGSGLLLVTFTFLLAQ